jgi:hypothetical protein
MDICCISQASLKMFPLLFVSPFNPWQRIKVTLKLLPHLIMQQQLYCNNK